jgi:hypothetical protein
MSLAHRLAFMFSYWTELFLCGAKVFTSWCAKLHATVEALLKAALLAPRL